MRSKVGLGIAKVFSEDECGVADSTLADYHDFSYESPTGLPVAVSLSLRFCPWCGVERKRDDQRRTIEVIGGD